MRRSVIGPIAFVKDQAVLNHDEFLEDVLFVGNGKFFFADSEYQRISTLIDSKSSCQ
jgi:hypothetical protein